MKPKPDRSTILSKLGELTGTYIPNIAKAMLAKLIRSPIFSMYPAGDLSALGGGPVGY